MDLPVSYEPLDPAVAGVDPDALQTLLERAGKEVADGLLPSAQLALAKDGRLVATATYGEATDDTRYVVFSCTKALIAASLAMLLAEGKLDVGQKVAEIVPEFGTNGKDVVTVEQVLLHTGGFPHAPLGPPEWSDRERRLEVFARWRLTWEPGTQYEYHPTSGHWVLAEIIERLSGMDYRRFVQTRIVEPLGLRSLRLGVPAAEQDDIATLEVRGEPASAEELQAVLGVSALPDTEVTDEALVRFNDPAFREVGVPGGGGVSTAADLALFYQALLHNAGGLWDADVLSQFVANPRNQLPDRATGVPANRALGIVIAGDDGMAAFRGFGHTVSPRAFGHNGAAGQIAWADPETGISFCWFTNGIDANVIRQGRRGASISSKAGAVVPR